MKSIINRHTAAWKKFAGITLVLIFGLVAILPGTAEARLIFTTEDDGVNADAYHLDNDDSSADFIDLAFGTGLTNRLRYDIVNGKFLLNNDLNLEGNALENFRVENAAAALTCAAVGDKGRMYYDTATNDLYFCNGTQWVSTSANATALAGAGLVVNGSALDVNVDDSTIEINADVVRVKDGGITSAKILDGTITAGDLGTGSVGTDEIIDGSITTTDILDGTITAGDLGTNSVAADEIATGAVTTDEILDGTITTGDINLAGFTVGSGQITDGSVTADDLGTGSVGSDEVINNSLTADDLATGSVGTAEIIDGSVGTADITAGANNTFLTTDGTGNVVWELKSSFMSSALASGQLWVGNAGGVATAVTASGDATIANTGAITIAGDVITSAKILDGTITANDLGTNSVAADEIATGAVTTDEILDGTITTGDINLAGFTVGSGQITDGSVTADDLGTGSVGSDEVINNSLTADDLATGSVGTAELAADAVTSAKIAADTIIAGDIATGAVTTDEILDGTVGTSDLNAASVGNNKTLTTDGTGNMVWVDDASPSREVSAHVAPEFSNFTLRADGTNNKGSLESDHDGVANKNYYKWETRKTGAMHDYDVVFQWMVPDDFQSWTAAKPSIEVDYKTDTATVTDNKLDITMTDTAGTAVTLAGTATGMVSTTADTWVEDTVVAAASLAGTYTPGEYVTITIKMSSKATTTANRNPAYLGAFNFNYVAK